MILCDFEDLNKEDFHLKFYDAIVYGNYDLVCEILKHPKLSKQFDITHKNYHCIIASILNSQHTNDCHLDFLKLFTQSNLLKKHANPTLCEMNDAFCGPLGNCIVFTPIETIRFMGNLFNDNSIYNLDNLIILSVLNNKKDAFFYLVEERKLPIHNISNLLTILKNFNNKDKLDKEMLSFIDSYDSSKHLLNTNSPILDTSSNNLHGINKMRLKNKFASLKSNKTTDVVSLKIIKIPENQWKSKFKQNL